MNNLSGVVYKALNQTNGKIYIGITRKTLESRKKEHIRTSKSLKGGWYFHKSINKHGLEAFSWEIIKECVSESDLIQSEKFFISYYQSYLPQKGYNLTFGGDGCLPNEETRKKISNSLTGKRQSEETKAKRKERLTASLLEKYGVSNVACLPKIKAKGVQTSIKKYGKAFNYTHIPFLPKEDLIDLHLRQKLTLGEIGKRYELTAAGVSYWMKIYGIEVIKRVVYPRSKQYLSGKDIVEKYLIKCLELNKILSFYEYGNTGKDRDNLRMKRLFNKGKIYSHLKNELFKIAVFPNRWPDFLSLLD